MSSPVCNQGVIEQPPVSHIHGVQELNAEITIRELKAKLNHLHETCDRQQFQMQEIQGQLLEILNSTWWRVGEPFRLAGRRFPRLSRTIRYIAWSVGKTLHYSKKGTLYTRVSDYLRRRIAMHQAQKTDLRKALNLPKKNERQLRAEDINLPHSNAPTVSVVIPSYGQVEYVLKCLASIAAAPPKVSIEVILAEDASGDPNVEELSRIKNLHFINREINLGFLRSSNDAVKSAKGEFIFLLNNDTEVMEGAIDSLVELARARPDAGIIGARLIYEDGRLQEAGGIVWQDGSAWNYGRLEDPRRPEYNYVREIDYASGAAMLVPRKVWDQLDGFDDQYAPAYCEDSDLAFRVRKAGMKVLYQPNASVIHHEGISHGTDVLAGGKANQIINNRKLLDRWKEVFLKEHYPNATRIMRARDKSMNKKIILVIDQCVPQPDRDAGSRTIFQFIETLLQLEYIVKFWPQDGFESPQYTRALQNIGVEVLYGPWSGEFSNWIQKNGYEIDEVLLSRPTVAPMFLPALRKFCSAPIIFYGHDLHFVRMENEARTVNDQNKYRAAQEMKELERSVWLSVDRVLYPSLEEAKIVTQIEPSVQAGVISPYAFSGFLPRTQPPSAPEIIFVAGFRHSPNIDAALWFCHEVWPRIRALRPDCRLNLVGSNPTKAVQALAQNNINVTGYVSDEVLAHFYSSSRVVVAPMRWGAGVKMKVVEALREGIPLVTTSTGIQGMEGLCKIIDVHDDAESFAKAVLKLLNDDQLWIQRSAAQAEYAATHFSGACMRDGLKIALDAAHHLSYEAVA